MLASEFKDRVHGVRARLAEAGLDAMVVVDRANTRYLSGFTGTASQILITGRGAYFITDSRYIERARRDIHGFKVIGLKKPGEDALQQVASRLNLRKVGFEGSVPFETLKGLRKSLSPARLQMSKVLKDCRIVKSDFELELMRQAQRAAEKILDRLLGEVCPGMTERHVRNRILQLIEEANLEGPSFAPIIASGTNSSMPHAEFTDRKIARRDILTIDMGVIREGYCSDMTRTVFFGQPSSEMRKVYETVLEAQRRGLEAVRAGARAKKVDAAARDFIDKQGYGKSFGHGLGHGVGIDIHEAPTLNQRSKDVLREGMIVTVEPGIYLEGRFGVRIEDTVIVRPDGCENLMRFAKDLTVI
jgi:Xaa-Pro aminopeptidase